MALPARLDRKSHLPDPVVVCEICGKSARFSEQTTYQSRPFFALRRFCSRACSSARKIITLEEMYERDVVRAAEGCWDWSGAIGVHGYPLMRRNKADTTAHRFAAEKAAGHPIPPGMVVMHTCDNPRCSNPEHLRIATPSENTRDMYAKGRWRRKT